RTLDGDAEECHADGREHDRAAEAGEFLDFVGEVRADRIERAVREIHDPAEAEDHRQPERQHDVIRTDEQPVDDLFEDDGRHNALTGWCSVCIGRCAAAHCPRRRGARLGVCDAYAIRQGFSACVGWINSRSSFAPGTGWTMSNMSHLSFIFALSLTLTTYISCSSW